VGLKPVQEVLIRVHPHGFRRTLVGLKRSRCCQCRRWRGFRRTLVGLKPMSEARATHAHPSFRRTLVGLKHRMDRSIPHIRCSFRRTLVGLKLTEAAALSISSEGFRRTLVGLKQALEIGKKALRELFQTNPCGVEARTTGHWG